MRFYFQIILFARRESRTRIIYYLFLYIKEQSVNWQESSAYIWKSSRDDLWTTKERRINGLLNIIFSYINKHEEATI